MRHVTIQLSDAQEALLSERLAHSDYGSLDELVAGLLESATSPEAWAVLRGEQLTDPAA